MLYSETNFKFASSLIKVISVVIALMVMMVSKYLLIFFTTAMLPSIFAIFFDRNKHRCFSANICSFNLIGVLPYLISIWQSNSIEFAVKQILVNIETWGIIYGATFIGHLLYISIPLLVVKFFSVKNDFRIMKYKDQCEILCKEWEIDI